MFNLRTLVSLSLALAVTACNGKDKDNSDETDVEPEETGETGEPGSEFFQPASASMFYEFAADADGALAAYKLEGELVPPQFLLTLTDSSQTDCVLVYQLDLDAYAEFIGTEGGDTDTDVPDTDTDVADTDTDVAIDTDTDIVTVALTEEGDEFADWLDGQGQFLGFALRTGLYEPLISQGCSLDPAAFGESPHEFFLESGWDFAVSDSVSSDAEDALAEADVTLADFYGEIDLDNAFSGALRLPDGFFGAGSPRDYPTLGLAGAVDEDMELQADAEGNLVLVPAADLLEDGVATPAVYRMQPLFGITFGN